MKRVEIFQISEEAQNAHFKMFSGLDMLERVGLKFDFADYKKVYSGEMDAEDPEDVYMALQGAKPEGFKGHSLSVSDLVKMDGKLYFCDSYGFEEMAA